MYSCFRGLPLNRELTKDTNVFFVVDVVSCLYGVKLLEANCFKRSSANSAVSAVNVVFTSY